MKLSPQERVKLAIKILGSGARADIAMAITAVEKEAQRHRNSLPQHANWRDDFSDFKKALQAARHHVQRLRSRIDPQELIDPLDSELKVWIKRCERQLNHPGILHQRQTRRNDAVDKREAGLQAWRALSKYGKPADTREGRRLHNKLAAILHGNPGADLRRYCRQPFIHAGVGNLISPFRFRWTKGWGKAG